MNEKHQWVLPYGDTLNDGKVQLSFTLPLPLSEKAIAAAKQMVTSSGFINPEVVLSKALDPNFSFFVVYAKAIRAVDVNSIECVEETTDVLTKEEIESFIQERIKKDIVVVGATTGTDAHTVGLDAIMNMKGYAGHYGLERYQGIITYNMGSQVSNEDFIKKAKDVKADVLLVSQTVTQKDVHVKNLIELGELLEAENIRDEVILIVGGARITKELAKELGYDAGFGMGKYAEDVASFFVQELYRRKESIL